MIGWTNGFFAANGPGSGSRLGEHGGVGLEHRDLTASGDGEVQPRIARRVRELRRDGNRNRGAFNTGAKPECTFGRIIFVGNP
jgi:hypothetical protein